MKNNDIIYSNRPKSQVASMVFYNRRDVAFAKYGPYWRQVKSISVLHMLNRKKVQSFRKIREEEVCSMIKSLKKSSTLTLSDVPVNLSEIFVNITNDMVSRVAFGRKYSGDDGCVSVKELLKELNAALGAGCVGDFIPWLSWIDHVSGVTRRTDKVAKTIDMFLEKIVQEHIDRADLQSRSEDFVDVLLDLQRNDPTLQKDTIKAILLDTLGAGIDTISTLLEWSMSELLLHPEAMKKLQDEVKGITKSKTIIDEDDLPNMKYLKAVIKEALRLHPPLPLLLFRESSQKTKVENYDIAAESCVIINAWAIHRDPASWDNPEEFRPERFVNKSHDLQGSDLKYIPFGSGRRGCPGISFATAKAELVLANVVGHFDWELPVNTHLDSFKAEACGVAVHKLNPIMAIPKPCSQI